MLFGSRAEEVPIAPWDDEESAPPRRPLPLPLRHLLGFSAGGSAMLILANFLHFLAVADHPPPQGPDPGDLLIIGTILAPLVAVLAGASFAGTIAILGRKVFAADPPRRIRPLVGLGVAFGLLLWIFPSIVAFLLVPPALAAAASFIRLRSLFPCRGEDGSHPPGPS